MADTTTPVRTSGKAVVALVLGLLSLVCLVLTGLPALLLGFFALREINRSDGRLGGRRPAIAGMVLGAAGTSVVLVWLVGMLLLHLREISNRTVCQNNLRALGLAVNLYYEDAKLFPAGTIPNPDLRPEQRLSWMVSI